MSGARGLTRRRLIGGLLGGAATVLMAACQLRPQPLPAVEMAPPAAPAAAPPAPVVPTPFEPNRRDIPRETGLDELIRHLGVDQDAFEAFEARYFAGLRELLSWHGRVGPTDTLDRHTFGAAIRRLQAERSLPETGLPDDAMLWELGVGRAKARRLEIERVEADRWPGRPGADHFELREDAAASYRALRKALKELGAVVTSAGALRELSAPLTPGRVPASLHHAGLAFDLATTTGMQNPKDDPYLVTQEGAGWRIWARAERGHERSLTTVFWRDGKPSLQDVKAKVVDFTELAQRHGFRGIGVAAGFPATYDLAEWWHFQYEAALTPFLSQFGLELLSLRRYSEDGLRGHEQIWQRRTDRFVFDPNRGSWRFAASDRRITAEASERYYRIVAGEIRRTLRDYAEIPVAVPAVDPLAAPTATKTSTKHPEITLKTPYWIYGKESIGRRAAHMGKAHAELQAAFKAAPPPATFGKGTPSEIAAAVQGALNTGRVRSANGAWPPTQADVVAWMHNFGVGVDCSGFVYEALTRVEKALAAQGLGGLAVPRLGGPNQLNSRHSMQGHRVARPRDLSVGDVMYLAPRPADPVGHVRIVDSVEVDGDGVVTFTTAESTAAGPGGPRAVRWRFPDASKLASLERDLGDGWRPAPEREHSASYWRHLPLMRTGLTALG